MKELFKDHLNRKLTYVRTLLEQERLDSLIIDSGFPMDYFHDDQSAFFRPNPHFSHYCPDTQPGHLLQINNDGNPLLVYFQPDDFWHEVRPLQTTFWDEFFDIKVVGKADELWGQINISQGNHVCLTPAPERAVEMGLDLVSEDFLSALNWGRISKTDYEVMCLRKANELAALGHKAAAEAFFAGKSEREVFYAFMTGTQVLEKDFPYNPIIAFDEKSAILHYQNTRTEGSGQTFLIDAGASYNGYASDITRTYFRDSVLDEFKQIHRGVDESQQRLCQKICAGHSYPSLQEEAHFDIAKILCDVGVVKGIGPEEVLELELTNVFFPHGVGHALGLQVHDVGGKQKNEHGQPVPANSKYPYLRTLRDIQERDVLTVEPGLYFIPMLLKPVESASKMSQFLNRSLIDALKPFGGVRIEDDVFAGPSGPENLTRPYLP
ncbi:MAG: Xaa-Pro dipeptidase [Bdellovibrionales bacterium]|nr:Xaa-Pro dipeptidase [Bdellovibrionales bacterium]